MKILVTGGSGFIGKNFLHSVKPVWQVVATYWKSRQFIDFVKNNALRNVIPIQVDLSSSDEIDKIADLSQEFDCCVYLASNGDPAISVNMPAFDLVSNTLTLVNLVEKIRFDTFIYFSSGAVYDGLRGRVSPNVKIAPRLPYAISKMASEHYLKHFQSIGQIKRLFVLRFFGAYGPYEPPRKIYSRLVRQFAIAKNPRFTVRGNGQNLIDAMYVGDAVRAIQMLLDSEPINATLDLYSGNPLSVTELVKNAARIFDLEPEISYEGDVPEYIEFFSDDEYMKKRYGFSPSVPLESGLLRLLAYVQSNEV